ncbi:hypothetical protein ACFYRC_33755 [Streptomyces sp. NPDC005279]|uniref:hypothetical protein n=1 Tax=Streptomyces sp. NPDC005279 TaxID=3364712 RepID=UPI0036CE58E9
MCDLDLTGAELELADISNQRLYDDEIDPGCEPDYDTLQLPAVSKEVVARLDDAELIISSWRNDEV